VISGHILTPAAHGIGRSAYEVKVTVFVLVHEVTGVFPIAPGLLSCGTGVLVVFHSGLPLGVNLEEQLSSGSSRYVIALFVHDPDSGDIGLADGALGSVTEVGDETAAVDGRI